METAQLKRLKLEYDGLLSNSGFNFNLHHYTKHYAELFLLYYSACWVASVGVVIAFGTYEWWGNRQDLLLAGLLGIRPNSPESDPRPNPSEIGNAIPV